MPVSSMVSVTGRAPISREPLGHRAPPPVRCDDQIGREFGPVVEPHAGHGRSVGGAAVGSGQADRGDAGTDRHVGLGERGPTQHPFEGGATARDHHQVVVAGLGRELHLGWDAVTEAHLGRTLGEQRLEDVGLVVAQQIAQAGEEGVAVPHLRSAASVPLERLVGGRRHRRVVALDHRHLVPGPSELQRRRQPGHAAADHDDVHGSKTNPSKSPDERHRSMYWKYATGPSG